MHPRPKEFGLADTDHRYPVEAACDFFLSYANDMLEFASNYKVPKILKNYFQPPKWWCELVMKRRQFDKAFFEVKQLK